MTFITLTLSLAAALPAADIEILPPPVATTAPAVRSPYSPIVPSDTAQPVPRSSTSTERPELLPPATARTDSESTGRFRRLQPSFQPASRPDSARPQTGGYGSQFQLAPTVTDADFQAQMTWAPLPYRGERLRRWR